MTGRNLFNPRPDSRKVEEQKSQNIIFTSGVNNARKDSIVPVYEATEAEKVIAGTSNSFIILGNDRPAGIASGNGGRGVAGASCIDIVVGMSGERPVEQVMGKTVLTQKDFKNDSARIYISKMCNLDEYFQIPSINAKITNRNEFAVEQINNTSGIGLKADHIRVIGRENIKLVTNHAGINGNSTKGPRDGIYLIAGYDMLSIDKNYQLEPMVLGNKLVAFLEKLLENLQNVQNNISSFIDFQMKFNSTLMNHVHTSGAPGMPTDKILGASLLEPMLEMTRKSMPDSIYNSIKNEMIKQYLQCGSSGYINSMWHKLN